MCPEERSLIWNNDSEDLNCDKISYQDAKFLEKVNSETFVTKSGHYEMPLPFNGDEPIFPNNRAIAEKRLMGLKHKMAKNQDYHSVYVGSMEEIIAKGYAEPCKEDPVADHLGWYAAPRSIPSKDEKRYAWYSTLDLNTMESMGIWSRSCNLHQE